MDALSLLANVSAGLTARSGRQQGGMAEGWGDQAQGFHPGQNDMRPPVNFPASSVSGQGGPTGAFPTINAQHPIEQGQPRTDSQDQLRNWVSQWYSGLQNTQQFGGLNWLNSSPWWQNMSQNFESK